MDSPEKQYREFLTSLVNRTNTLSLAEQIQQLDKFHENRTSLSSEKWLIESAPLDMTGWIMCESGRLHVHYSSQYAIEYCLFSGAKLKNSTGMVYLAECYFQGIGTAISERIALKWLNVSAAMDNPLALNKLGSYYRRLYSYTANFYQYMKFFKQSAELQYAPGMFNLSCCYFNKPTDNEGERRHNVVRGVDWLIRSVQAGRDCERTYNVLTENTDQMIDILESEAEKKQDPAVSTICMRLLALFHLRTHRHLKSVYWFNRAIDLGDDWSRRRFHKFFNDWAVIRSQWETHQCDQKEICELRQQLTELRAIKSFDFNNVIAQKSSEYL